ncbi:hypothetical protein HG535_0A01850 [Zygotorulaspora mrakii]|uniref:Uncharacterized protein n=1 Tax=Zygotorulaspora mrakii TaxID=42260 RepID=A0A7H9AVQ9_ZYGMR|nr:uncharacterized protein HG535_0A01850 [Zygotorulaspora mrakii]QLG70247.1 hypothetical protein HG535_0A01850 [Zygotorulaspora mrakii]
MDSLFLNKSPGNSIYKCHKNCNDVSKSNHIYDKCKLQKLKEIFDFDYLIRDCNEPQVAKCCHEHREKTRISDSGEVRHYANMWNHRTGDIKEDDYLYAPLECVSSSSYPLSLPPPRSDADIVPVSSSISSYQPNTLSNIGTGTIGSSSNKDIDTYSSDTQRQLLLYDLLSGDIYDN